MLGDPDLLVCRRRPAFNRLLPSRLAPAAPALGAKSRRSAPICPALRLQHCTNLGSVYTHIRLRSSGWGGGGGAKRGEQMPQSLEEKLIQSEKLLAPASAAQGRDSHGPRGGHSPGPTVDLYHFRRFGPVHLSQTPWPHEQRHSRDV
ncbi:hypothetical protein NQZ68_014305 [Dissostichus eleginoides]|nr:hypothetical protein NQZ68_014305 [Dissostichus eleginoides]